MERGLDAEREGRNMLEAVGKPIVDRLVRDFSWAHCEHPGELHVDERCEFCTVSWQLVQNGSLQTGTSVVAPDGVLTRAYVTKGDKADAAPAAAAAFKAEDCATAAAKLLIPE